MAHNPLNQSRGFDAWTFTFRLDWSWSKSRRRLLKRCSASTTAIPVIRNMALEGCFIFQQDSAPGHRAMQRHNRNAKKRNTRSDFVPPTLWPPNSPDLDPIIYTVWSVILEQVYHANTNSWCKLSQATIVGCMGGMKSGSMNTKCERSSVEAAMDTIIDLPKLVGLFVRNSRFKHSYLFIL